MGGSVAHSFRLRNDEQNIASEVLVRLSFVVYINCSGREIPDMKARTFFSAIFGRLSDYILNYLRLRNCICAGDMIPKNR